MLFALRASRRGHRGPGKGYLLIGPKPTPNCIGLETIIVLSLIVVIMVVKLIVVIIVIIVIVVLFIMVVVMMILVFVILASIKYSNNNRH